MDEKKSHLYKTPIYRLTFDYFCSSAIVEQFLAPTLYSRTTKNYWALDDAVLVAVLDSFLPSLSASDASTNDVHILRRTTILSTVSPVDMQIWSVIVLNLKCVNETISGHNCANVYV